MIKNCLLVGLSIFQFSFLSIFALCSCSTSASQSCPTEFTDHFKSKRPKQNKIQTIQIDWTSKALGNQRARVFLTLPSGFPFKNKKLPLVFFLHGRGGEKSKLGQLNELGGEKSADRLFKGRVCQKPFVVVAPVDLKSSYWREGPGKEQGTESMIVHELYEILKACGRDSLDFQTLPALGGISAGGNAALYYGGKYSGKFGQIYSLSPVFRPDEDEALLPEDRRAFGRGSDFNEQDIVWLYKNRFKTGRACNYPVDRFRMEIAKDDVFINAESDISEKVVENTRQFISQLVDDCPGRAFQPSRTGGHSPLFWRAGIERMYEFFCEGFVSRTTNPSEASFTTK